MGVAAACCLCSATALSQSLEYATLPDLINRGSQALTAGDFATAAQAFNAIRRDYSEEAQWLESRLPETLLPLAAFASLRSGQPSEALEALDSYFALPAGEPGRQSFARYTQALAFARNEQTEQAREAYAALATEAPSPSISGIALLGQARLSPHDAAAGLLQEALAKPLSERVAIQARLALVRLQLEAGEVEAAQTTLLEVEWQEVAMPEMATLSFLAFELGDALLSERPDLALQAYRLVAPRDTLITLQRQRLDELEGRVRDRAPELSPDQAIWLDFYRELLASLEAQLQALEAAADYQRALQLRKARCLQALRRPLESWLLLEELSLSGDPEVAALAHRQWMGLARDIQAWNASAVIGRRYLEMYPDRDDAEQALYWIGQAQLELEQYEAATASFAALAERTSDPQLQASSLYFQGICLSQLGRRAEAIRLFTATREAVPEAPIAAQATLWIGICAFLEENYSAARAAFEAVVQRPDWAFAHGEASFRVAYCAYALEDAEAAIDLLRKWLQEYPAHAREAEAALLYGDLLRERGDWQDALKAYALVEPEQRQLRFYAVAGMAQIHSEQDRLDSATTLLWEYEAEGLPPVLAGDFYQLALALLQTLGERDEALATAERGLRRFGDLLEAEGVEDLALFVHPDPDALAARRDQALQARRPTLAARYQLALSRARQAGGESDLADVAILELAQLCEPEELPPACLAALGSKLVAIGSIEAPDFLRACIDRFPDSRATAAAYIGMARHAERLGHAAEALDWLGRAAALPQLSLSTGELNLLQARLLQQVDRTEEAVACYIEALGERELPSETKAEALRELGSAYRSLGDDDAAYASFERVFTLYRGARTHVAACYLECAQILADRDRLADALAVCSEFLSQNDLATQPAFHQAEQLMIELESRIQTVDASHASSP